MIVYCDIDGVLCNNTFGEYENAVPDPLQIAMLNEFLNAGHHVTLWTARGTKTGQDWSQLTVQQMRQWGVDGRAHIRMGKPEYDLFIDDKSTAKVPLL